MRQCLFECAMVHAIPFIGSMIMNVQKKLVRSHAYLSQGSCCDGEPIENPHHNQDINDG